MSDWIKMRTSFGRDGRVRKVSRTLATNVTHVCGGLYLMWSLADEIAVEQTGGGALLEGYEPADMDDHVGTRGFTESLPECWMEVRPDGLYLPDYMAHNGSTAKKRAQDQKRQSKKRRQSVAGVRDEKATREDKTRREVLSTLEEEGTSQKSPSPLPPEASGDTWKLIGAIEKELSCPLHALGHHARILERQWRSKFTDAQILEASVQAADWLRSISGHKMDGLFGVLKRFDPNRERPWKNRCPFCGQKGFYDRPSWTRPNGPGTQLMTQCVKCNHRGPVSAQIEKEIKGKSGKRGKLDQEALLR